MRKFEHSIIMAAGRGARLSPFTAIIPKAMIPYLNTTLIGNGIKKLRPKIQNIHVTVGYKGSILAQHVINLGVDSIFHTNGKGNSWWVYNTLMKHLDEPVLVLTCDNVVDLDLEWLAKQYADLKEPPCLLIPVKPVPTLEGDYIFEKNRVIYKLDRNTPSEIYCSGIQIINPRKINELTKATESFYELWDQLMAKKLLYVSEIYPKRWFTVDTIEHLKQLMTDESD